jgi:hypothetical protein
MKKHMTFEDIEKLNYQQINMVSNKYGEDEFNPHDIFDMNDDPSESDQDEVLRRFRSPNHHPAISMDQGSLSAKKYSKPHSNYSHQEHIQMIANGG